MADGEQDDELSVEEEARIKGWKPLDEYTGPPSRWRDAETFLRIGKDDNRILREENRRLATKVDRLDNQVTGLVRSNGEQVEALKGLRELAQRADQRGYERARIELVQQRREAVETGNTELFDQLEEQVRTLDKSYEEKPVAPAGPTPAPPAPQIEPEVIAFTEANPWFSSNRSLNAAMINYVGVVDQKYPTWPLADRLEEAKRRVVEEFPEHFPEETGMTGRRAEEEEAGERPRPARASRVATPSGQAPRPRNREPQGFDQITDPVERAEARRAFDGIKKWDPGYTEAEYLAVYFEPRADELALRSQRSAAR